MTSKQVCNESRYRKHRWTDEDKWTLLDALTTHGYHDQDKICAEFPLKSKSSVKTMISKYRFTASKSCMRKSQIEEWIDSNEFPDVDATPELFKFISLFEEDPSLDENVKYHLQAVYDALHRAALGFTPIDVSEIVYKTICHVLKTVTTEVWPASECEIHQFVENLKVNKKKVYPPAKKIKTIQN